MLHVLIVKDTTVLFKCPQIRALILNFQVIGSQISPLARMMVFISLAFQLSQLTCCCGNQFFWVKMLGSTTQTQTPTPTLLWQRLTEGGGHVRNETTTPNAKTGRKKKMTGPLRIGWDLFLNDIVPCSDSLVKWKHKMLLLSGQKRDIQVHSPCKEELPSVPGKYDWKKSYNTWVSCVEVLRSGQN